MQISSVYINVTFSENIVSNKYASTICNDISYVGNIAITNECFKSIMMFHLVYFKTVL